jgi:anaerobic ribonucleoside-triphosphate reductase activating protein
MKSLYIARLQAVSYVDGPGARTVLWLQGCPIHCPGCQNPTLWPERVGFSFTAPAVARELVQLACDAQGTSAPAITITGGEPFAQAEGLVELLYWVRAMAPQAHVIVYTGYTWEELRQVQQEGSLPIGQALGRIDVLVDGPYVQALDHDGLQWRGSANQRPINVRETLTQGRIITEPWDAPVVTVTPAGEVVAAADVVAMFEAVGAVEDAARCGQASGRREACDNSPSRGIG